MKKSTLAAAVGLAMGGAALSAQAALIDSAVLQYAPGTVGNYTSAPAAGASWFTMQVAPTVILWTGVQAGVAGGVHIGSNDLPAGVVSHGGLPYGGTYTSDIGGIDTGWAFFSNTGMHFTATPVTVVTDSGFTKTLDFSGWRVTWNTIPTINMGGGMQVVSSLNTKNSTISYTTYNNGTGLATITCSNSSCSNSSEFTLDYAAVVPKGDASGFGGVAYTYHLTSGTTTDTYHVQSVPVPAAAWLFGSGLLGLVGIARRKKKASA